MRLVILLVDCSVVQQWGGQGGQCPAGQWCSTGLDRVGNVQRVSGAAPGWTGWAMSSGSVVQQRGGQGGQCPAGPRVHELPTPTSRPNKNINNFPVTVGETFNRFTDVGL